MGTTLLFPVRMSFLPKVVFEPILAFTTRDERCQALTTSPSNSLPFKEPLILKHALPQAGHFRAFSSRFLLTSLQRGGGKSFQKSIETVCAFVRLHRISDSLSPCPADRFCEAISTYAQSSGN